MSQQRALTKGSRCGLGGPGRGSYYSSVSGADKYPQVNPQQKLVIKVVNDSEMVTVFPGVSARSILRDSGKKSSWLRTARNTPMLSSGWSEGTIGASPEECRQSGGRAKLEILP